VKIRMRTDRMLLFLACAGILAIGAAIFSLREAPIPLAPSPSGPRDHPSNAPSAPGASPIQVPSPEDSAADYFPLSDGFLRNYLVEVSYKSEPPRFGIARVGVEGREKIREREYYKVLLRVTGITEMSDPVLRYCRKAGDAWLELDGREKSNPAFETVTLPLPPSVGVRWDKETPEERSNWKVEGTQTVELFGKQYPKCLRIAYERHLKQEPAYFETGHYFLAPGVGLIQQVAMASGTRISFTLDERPPEAIAFCTAWAGTYQAVTDRRTGGRQTLTGGHIQLLANGRYTMIRSWSDSAVDSGAYERNPNRDGEIILRNDTGHTSTYSYRRTEPEPGRAVLRLKCVSENVLLGEEFLRDAPSP
jgi:hypothetical protein